MSGLSVKPLTAHHKYSRHNTEDLLQPIQMHFRLKQNPSSLDFIAFLEFALSLTHFHPHRLSISEIIDSEKRMCLNA